MNAKIRSPPFCKDTLDYTRDVMVRWKVGNQANGGEVAHTFGVMKISFS